MSSENNKNNMTDIDALVSAMATSQIDLNGSTAQINSLTEQLKRSTILDSQNLSLQDAQKILETTDVTSWVFSNRPKTHQQLLEEAAFAVVTRCMSQSEPAPVYTAAAAWAWYGTRYYPSPSTWHEFKGDESEMEKQKRVNFAEIVDKEEAVRQRYGYYTEFGGEDLANAVLPEDPLDLSALGFVISDELLVDYHSSGGDAGTLLFSPTAHRNYPYWLPEHRVNEYIKNAYQVMATGRQLDQLNFGVVDMSEDIL
jgi:hypothetical protein